MTTPSSSERVVLPDPRRLLPEADELAWYFMEYLRFPEGGNIRRAGRIELALRQGGATLSHALAASAPLAWKYIEDHIADVTLRIEVEPARGASAIALPWEGLVVGDRVASVEAGLVVDRRVARGRSRARPRSGPGLRVLLVIARPAGLGYVDTGSTPGAMVDAIDGVGSVEIRLAPDGTADGMATELWAASRAGQPFDVVHFDGHGGLGPGGPALYFESEDQGADPIETKTFQSYLHRAGVRGALLDACRTAEHQRGAPAMASQLVELGLEWAVGMADVVQARLTAIFCRAFYGALAAGSPVPLATVRGHRAAYGERHRPHGLSSIRAELEDWWLPRCFVASDVVGSPIGSRTPATPARESERHARLARPDSDLALIDGGLTLQTLREIASQRLTVLSGLLGSGMPARAGELAYWAHHLGVFPGGVFSFTDVAELRRVATTTGGDLPTLVVMPNVVREDVPALREWLGEAPRGLHLAVTTDDYDLGLARYQGEYMPLRSSRMAHLVYRRAGIVVMEGSERWLCLQQSGGHLGAIDQLCSLWATDCEAGSPAFLLEAVPPEEQLGAIAARVRDLPVVMREAVAAVAAIGGVADGDYFADACERAGCAWADVAAWLGRRGLARRQWQPARADRPEIETLSWVHPWLRHVLPAVERGWRAFLDATVREAENTERMRRKFPGRATELGGELLLAVAPRAIGLACDRGCRQEAEELGHWMLERLHRSGHDALTRSIGRWLDSRIAASGPGTGNAPYWHVEAIERAIEEDPSTGLVLASQLVADTPESDPKNRIHALRLKARGLVEAMRDVSAAIEVLREAESLAELTGDRAQLAAVYSDAVLCYQQLRDYPTALHFADLALARYLEDGMASEVPSARSHRAMCLVGLHRYSEAVVEASLALKDMERAGNWDGRASALASRALAYAELGEIGAAMDDHRTVLEICRSANDPREAGVLAMLGHLARLAGDESAARAWYDEGIRRARELECDGAKIRQMERWRDEPDEA